MAFGQLDYLERFAQGGWMLRFSASTFSWETVKETIKALPREDRFWNNRALGGRGAWWVSDKGLAQIASLFANYDEMREYADDRARAQGRAHEERQERKYQQPPPRSNMPMTRERAFAALFLLPGAPKEVAQAVHRALIKKYHPDLGGDEAQMKAVNLAYEVVEASYPKESK